MTGYSIQSISGKDRKELIRNISSLIETPELLITKKTALRRFSLSKRESAIVGSKNDIFFLDIAGKIMPYLKLSRSIKFLLPKVVVDIGAIKFVTNGADVMRPGITEIDDDVLESSLVLIVEERNKAPLAIGLSLYDSVDMKSKTSGKCIKNLHWLKDKWWDFEP